MWMITLLRDCGMADHARKPPAVNRAFSADAFFAMRRSWGVAPGWYEEAPLALDRYQSRSNRGRPSAPSASIPAERRASLRFRHRPHRFDGLIKRFQVSPLRFQQPLKSGHE